ncbi:MAG: hypothetical protein Tsb002_03010 [Wenzhouxiangellaceae bacterium]
MKIKWKKKKEFKPSLLLERLLSISKPKPDRSIEYTSFEIDEITASIHAMINFDNDIVQAIREKTINTAIRESIFQGSTDPQQFIDAANKELRKLLSKREERYTLLTTISMSGERLFKTLDFLDCKIRFTKKNYPKKYKSRLVQERQYSSNSTPIPTPRRYQKVLVSTMEKHPHSAAHRCLKSLDTYRAICCLFINPSMQYFFNGPPRPLNTIILGGLHTLHKQNGKLADENCYWYEPHSNANACNNTYSQNIPTTRKNIKWLIQNINSSKYSNRIIGALLRYARAFDEVDTNTIVVKMWGALETLAKEENEKYDTLIHRCAFLTSNPEIHQQRLECIREFRNSNVHIGENSDESRIYCYQIQFYLRQLVLFHAKNCGFFADFKEANSFLDLPYDQNNLRLQKKLIDKALFFRGYEKY